ncbi:aldehyde dehydrogenase family protein [Aliivibrio fischeri]|uniref:aldehyde dehydrogenase family protein n=1 Tax=Aliivibrio fischeri TaxID=668 RepID=UPI00080E3E9B|nr:aldehyde dehydrogenase family protein [Aliivibrio fischeri]MUK28985.1 aldehyde dehydrogenase family protein [Aliivibrio fischeri]OCH37139.1 1-pyrroline-5-carboxylate dehydrogenase [Aliivibrio fischeri]
MTKMTQIIDSVLSQGLAEWQSESASLRVEKLLTWANQLAENPHCGVLAAKMVRYQCQRAQQLITDVELMPGPTGESNELYTAPRGVFYITSNKKASVVALIGQITAALVAGNAIIVALSGEDSEVASVIVNSLHEVNVPESTVQQVDREAVDINDERLAGVCFVGDIQKAIELNQQLAQRDGLLAQLIAETDQEGLTTITDPHFVLRFITERTRTINVTAVGGNATLLELGGGNH